MNTSSMISATLHQATDLHNIALSGWLTRVNLEALATIWLLFPLVGGYFMQSETLRDDNGNNAGLNRTPAKIANGYKPNSPNLFTQIQQEPKTPHSNKPSRPGLAGG